MDITPLIKSGQQVIQSYSGGRFRVGGVVYERAVIVTPDETFPWAVSDFQSLKMEDFAPLIRAAAQIDVVLLGCGARMEFLPPALKKELRVQGLVVESMDTGAACRTYNVLMAEGRRVVATLLPV